MRRLPFLRTALLLLILPVLPALGQQTGEYRIGPKDLVEIKVFEVPDLNLERRVNENGDVALPLLGDFKVGGSTAGEAAARLEAMLTAKYVNRASVSVIVKDFANKPVSVLGAVTRPGALNISGRWDLLQAISAAGGVTDRAGRKLYILRRAENGLSDQLEIDTAELFQRSSPWWNVPIWPSDVVNIPTRVIVKIFCLGEVKQPGALEFDGDDRLSLLTVIARAGGLTDRAARSNIRVKRRGPDGKDQEFNADYRRIVSGKDGDPELKPDDVVIVKESFF
jgi:polysaccharide export outer membrane protein